MSRESIEHTDDASQFSSHLYETTLLACTGRDYFGKRYGDLEPKKDFFRNKDYIIGAESLEGIIDEQMSTAARRLVELSTSFDDKNEGVKDKLRIYTPPFAGFVAGDLAEEYHAFNVSPVLSIVGLAAGLVVSYRHLGSIDKRVHMQRSEIMTDFRATLDSFSEMAGPVRGIDRIENYGDYADFIVSSVVQRYSV
jgi:hypothetical protein